MPKVVVTNTKGLVQEAGSGVDIQSPLTVRSRNITTVSAAKTLTAADCGEVILGAVGTTRAQGAGFTVTLPSPAVGLKYHFTLADTALSDNGDAQIIIDASTSIIVGMVEGTGANNGANVTAGKQKITFVKDLATCGDHVRLVCDGTNWFAVIKYDVDVAITLAD